MNKLYEQEHDMTKKMIDVMRNGNSKKINAPVRDEHDITKRMLETMRNSGRLLTEVEEVPAGGSMTAPRQDNNSTQASAQPSEGEDLNDDELAAQEKAFMDSVSPKVEFNEFKIYRKERNVVFSGNFQDLGGLEWVMSLKDSDGLNITVQSFKVDSDTISVLNKLHGFYVNWSKEWAVKLNTEYKNKE